MPTANIELPDGTTIKIEGDVDEIAKITALYRNAPPQAVSPVQSHAEATPSKGAQLADPQDKLSWPEEGVDIPQLVAMIKDCDEAELIEDKILDKSDVLPRVILPFYIGEKYFTGDTLLTSGDIEKITDQLGVKVPISSASRALSDKGKSYLSANVVRKKGSVVKYKINRRGMKYLEEVLNK
ncbi:MAG: hypothetical protein AAFQ22_01880 [Pseudomonadota bacterium]